MQLFFSFLVLLMILSLGSFDALAASKRIHEDNLIEFCPPKTRVKDSPTPYPVEDAERAEAIDELLTVRKKMIRLEGRLIAPSVEDLDNFADFLEKPKTGVIRLFPRGDSTELKPLLVSGGGSYYQFKGRTHEYGFGNDIEYLLSYGTYKHFRVGFAGVDFGFFAPLGKVDIRQINEQDPAVAFAFSYPSPNGKGEPAWRAEQQKWGKGVEQNKDTFKDDVNAVVGMSYVLRSVAEGHYDVVVAFQVIRQDLSDKSLILAWKILKEFEKPVLKQ